MSVDRSESTVKQVVGHIMVRADVRVFDSPTWTYTQRQMETTDDTIWILPDGYTSYEQIVQWEYDAGSAAEEARFRLPAAKIDFKVIYQGDDDSSPSFEPKAVSKGPHIDAILAKARCFINENRRFQAEGGEESDFYNGAFVLCIIEYTRWLVKVKNDSFDWKPWYDDLRFKGFYYSQQEEEYAMFSTIYRLMGFFDTSVFPFRVEPIDPIYFSEKRHQIAKENDDE